MKRMNRGGRCWMLGRFCGMFDGLVSVSSSYHVLTSTACQDSKHWSTSSRWSVGKSKGFSCVIGVKISFLNWNS